MAAAEIFVYIGTYTKTSSEGIYVYRLDPSTGALEYSSKAAGQVEPSFLAIDPDQRYLYAVNEINQFEGEQSGAVSAFSIDPATGALTFLNQRSSRGTGPCHLSVDQTGRYVLVANYAGGSASILPIENDGQLGEASDFVQHEGSSATERQQGPHAHSITPDASNRFAFVADLGLDKVLIYRLDQEAGKLKPGDPSWVQVQAGAGPRHFDFHPNGRYAYLINELDNTFTAFAYDQARGALTQLQTISTLPDDFDGTSYCADVHVAPSGKFVYGSNRGHDSIVICAIDENTGRLTVVGHESGQIANPRNFAIDPTAKFLFVANQDTDTVVSFHIDQQTGELEATGLVTEVPMPVCLKMITVSA